MKKIKRYAMAVALILSLVCLAVGLVACDKGPKLSALRIENARISFMRGDEFETGDDFTVIAVFSDGTEQDVTEEAEVRQENGMDMNVPGDYQITVSYGKKKEIYTVYVNDAEDVLRKIELDTAKVKKTYELGDSISFDNLLLKLTYENSQHATFTVETTSLKDLTVEIKSEDGTKSNGVFTSLGKFTVTVSKGAVRASYDVNVAGINISTVQGALTVGGFYKNKVVSGEALAKEEIADYGLKESSRYQYEYGKNYTRFSDAHSEDEGTYHCSVDDDGLFVIRELGGNILTNNRSNPDMMNGSPFLLWFLRDTEYGIESTLNNLYARAKVCSNDDLKETADEAKREYSFSFSGLELRSNSYDYFETTVFFTLSEDYTIATVEYRQDYYEDNSAWVNGERLFETDPVTGKTVPLGRPSHYTIVTVSQTAGERTAENPYSRDMFKIESFDLTYNGEKLEDGAVLEFDVATGEYTIFIENVLPATATLVQDPLYFNYDGNRGGASTWISNKHFSISQTESKISLTVKHGGTWTFYFMTENVTKVLTINVTGEDPTSMAPQIWNVASGSFYSGDSKILARNGEVYFYGAVDAYANGAQTAELTSGNAEYVTLEEVVKGGIKCFKFSASEAGTYEVTITSDTSSLSCTFTFTVSDAVDYDALLSGTYTVMDFEHNIYTLTFNRTDEDGLIKGTVSVTKTPTDEHDTPIESQAVTQTFAFYVDDMEITVEHENTDKLWIELVVNEENELMLVDQRNYRYKLTRVSE